MLLDSSNDDDDHDDRWRKKKILLNTYDNFCMVFSSACIIQLVCRPFRNKIFPFFFYLHVTPFKRILCGHKRRSSNNGNRIDFNRMWWKKSVRNGFVRGFDKSTIITFRIIASHRIWLLCFFLSFSCIESNQLDKQFSIFWDILLKCNKHVNSDH